MSAGVQCAQPPLGAAARSAADALVTPITPAPAVTPITPPRPVLDASQRLLVRRILDAELPDAEVFVFGSRATGRARPFSDLDLLVQRPAALSLDQQARLRDAFEASELPFRVDIVEAGALAPAMAERIAAERIALN